MQNLCLCQKVVLSPPELKLHEACIKAHSPSDHTWDLLIKGSLELWSKEAAFQLAPWSFFNWESPREMDKHEEWKNL